MINFAFLHLSCIQHILLRHIARFWCLGQQNTFLGGKRLLLLYDEKYFWVQNIWWGTDTECPLCLWAWFYLHYDSCFKSKQVGISSERANTRASAHHFCTKKQEPFTQYFSCFLTQQYTIINYEMLRNISGKLCKIANEIKFESDHIFVSKTTQWLLTCFKYVSY